MAGVVGTSNSPISGMTLATIVTSVCIPEGEEKQQK